MLGEAVASSTARNLRQVLKINHKLSLRQYSLYLVLHKGIYVEDELKDKSY
jgi:hypothetical protein